MKDQEAKVDYTDFEKQLFLSKLHDKPVVLVYDNEKEMWVPKIYGVENGHSEAKRD